MDRFEYRLGGFTGSIPQLEKKTKRTRV